MITKGIIKDSFKDKSTNKWHYRILLPTFHGNGTIPISELPEAIYATMPHMEQTKLTVGDIVVVGLENGSLEDLIILGLIPGTTESLLHSAESTESQVAATNIYSMQITGQAELPYTTNYSVIENSNSSGADVQYITGKNLSYLSDVTSPIQSQMDSIIKKLTTLYNSFISTLFNITIVPNESLENFYLDQQSLENSIGGMTEGLEYAFKYSNSTWTYDGKKIKAEDYGFNYTAVSANSVTLTITKLEQVGSGTAVSCGSIPQGQFICAHARSWQRGTALEGDQGQTYVPDDEGEVSMTSYLGYGFTKIIRLKNRNQRLKLANKAVYAANNPCIGYNYDNANDTFHSVLLDNSGNQQKKLGSINTPCNTNCNLFVGMLLISTGVKFGSQTPAVSFMETTTETVLNLYKKFPDLFEIKELTSIDLKIGDILWKRGHVAIMVSVPSSYDNWIGDDGVNYNPDRGEVSIYNKVVSTVEEPKPAAPVSTAPVIVAEQITQILNFLTSASDKSKFNSAKWLVAVKTSGSSCTVTCYNKVSDNWEVQLINNNKSNDGYVGKNGTCNKEDCVDGNRQTPTGLFELNETFGVAETSTYSKLASLNKYFKITDNDYWSGKPDATFNTHVTSTTKIEGEHLIEYTYAPEYYYSYCANISYNLGENKDLNSGYARFLHVGSEPNYGDVSVSQKVMQSMLSWMNTQAETSGAFVNNEYPIIVIY